MNDLFQSAAVQTLLRFLRSSPCSEAVSDWPGDRLTALQEAGVLRWNVPKEFGGLGLSETEMLEGYRLLASSCLTTTFILTQRNGACARIISSPNQTVQQTLLPPLVRGEQFATVGISHLTTSRRHLASPPVRVDADGDGFRLNGTIPWTTGATQADLLITGGELTDGRQLLAAVRVNQPGVRVRDPVELMALSASQTGSVELTDVPVGPDDVLHGPVEAVMRQGAGGGAGSLGTSVLAVGAAEGMLRQLEPETRARPDLNEFVLPLQQTAERIADQIHQAVSGQHSEGAKAAEIIRQQANSLVLRTAQTWLAATKGAGYVSGHPAERAVRESMFFLVWSCPQPVLTANLRELACSGATGEL